MTAHAPNHSHTLSGEQTRRLADHFRHAVELLSRPQPDFAAAFASLEAAAQEGVTAAHLDLAHLLQHGLGVPRDAAQARRHYLEAAQRGCRRAQVHLAVALGEGEGEAPHPEEALYWFTRAAEHGDRIAMGNLGIMYALGWGVPQDIVEAFLWLTSAVGMGHEAVREAQSWLQACLREEIPPQALPSTLKDAFVRTPQCELCLMETCDLVECQDEKTPFLAPLPPTPGQAS